MPLLSDNLIIEQQVNRGEKSDWFQVLAAALASDADRQSVDFVNKFNLGLLLMVKLATEVGAAGYTPKIQMPDEDGNQILIWAAAAELTAAGTYIYLLHPGGAANMGSGITAASDVVLPRVWNVLLDKTTGDTDQKFDTEVIASYV